MRLSAFPAILLGALALAACSNPDRFGEDGGSGQFAPGYQAPGTATAGNFDPATPEYFNQTIGDRVLFSVDQSTIDDEARQTLSRQAQWLLQNPSYTAVVEGHADEQGTREYNLALGARRAASARDFLVSQGVPANRLQTVTFGKERPIEVCSVESCYRQNRRAVTVIAAGATS